jgi:hypothetical protein
MKRVWGHLFTGLTLLAGVTTLGSAVSACVHDDSTVFVSEMLAPQLVSVGSQCLYTADPTQPHITSGVFDVALVSSYTGSFLLANQVVPRADPNQPQTETSFVTITGAVVTINDSQGNQLASYTKPVSVTIPPSSGTTPGFSPAFLEIVDPTTVAKLGVPYLSSVPVVTFTRFFGKTVGGDSVESNDFEFPIDVCNGCLIAYSAKDISPLFKAPNCVGNGSAGTSSGASSLPCIIGQDARIDCADCQGSAACRLNSDHPIVGGGVVDAGGGG